MVDSQAGILAFRVYMPIRPAGFPACWVQRVKRIEDILPLWVFLLFYGSFLQRSFTIELEMGLWLLLVLELQLKLHVCMDVLHTVWLGVAEE